MNIIVSPVGTSLLTNQANDTVRRLINKYSNAKTEKDIPQADLCVLRDHITARVSSFALLKAPDARRQSAELNGILGFFLHDPPQGREILYLVSTDTYIGRQTTSIIETWLMTAGFDTRIIEPLGLQTSLSADLRLALIDLVNKIDEIYETYKPLKAKLIFNLTGGFKAIQGFMQTLGSIYADETIYIFESADSLIRIPRLPIKMVAEDYIKNNVTTWRRLQSCLLVQASDLTDIPDTLYFEMDGLYALSEYGRIIWNNLKRDLYHSEVFPSPSIKIVFSETFRKSVIDLSPDRRYIMNNQIDKLAEYLENNSGSCLRSLDLKQLSHPIGISTCELDAWADQDAKRVFCHCMGDNVLCLDKLDKALH